MPALENEESLLNIQQEESQSLDSLIDKLKAQEDSQSLDVLIDKLKQQKDPTLIEKAKDFDFSDTASAYIKGGLVPEPISRGIKQFNIGIANMLGLPQVGADALRHAMGYEEGSSFPSSREIQQKMADLGMTYEPGEEPDELSDRIYQNLGAASIPVVGMTAKGYQATKAIVPEMLAAFGGAGGGKIAERTDWGKAHPAEARAIGELSGGLGLSSTRVLKYATTPAMAAYRLASAPYRGAMAKKRAIKRLSELVRDPDAAVRELNKLDGSDLTSSQKVGEQRLSGLRRRVEKDSLPEQEFGISQRSKASQELKQEAKGVERVAAVRHFLDQRLKNLAHEAETSLDMVKKAKNPEYYSTKANEKLWAAYNETRVAESKIWNSLKDGNKMPAPNIMKAYSDELSNITRGGDVKEIDNFLNNKLGKLNKNGKLIGGKFLTTKNPNATAKELHQFSSRITRQIRTLSEQAGNTNKIRILNRIKNAAIKDIEKNAVGEDYKAAIAFSRELNKKFTQGNIGSVLGFNRGTATSETLVLDELLGSGGEEARLAVEQMFKANPKAKVDVEDFIKSRFAVATVHPKTNRIDSRKGQQFLQKNNRLLDAFPKTRSQIEDAISKQKKVDSFMGSTDVTDVSPIVKEKAAAGIFINADPGDEIKKILQYGKSQGKTKKFFSDLVKETKRDKTGSAFRGLKNALAEELVNTSEMSKTKEGLTDVLTGDAFVSGIKFLRQLRRVKSPALKSGLLSKTEYKALEKIGESFKRIELELTSPVPKSIMTDAPGQVMDILARMAGAHIGGLTGASSAGGSLQMAQIGSGLSKKIINAVTKDEARGLLIEATRNPKLLKDLLTDASKLKASQQQTLLERIKNTALEIGNRSSKRVAQAQAPSMAVIPPVINVNKEQETLEDKIQRLKEM